MTRGDGQIVIENAQIIFRNFEGKKDQYNLNGDRSFAVLLDYELARVLEKDGWNVKQLKPRDGDEGPPQDYLSVAVSYKIKPPRLVLLTRGGRTLLGEEECDILDWVDIEFTDMTIRPYPWTVRGESGIKAYLKTLYVKIQEDPLDIKYASLEDLPARAGALQELPAAYEGEVVEGEWREG